MNDPIEEREKRSAITVAFFPAILSSSLFLYSTSFYTPKNTAFLSPFSALLILSLIISILTIRKGPLTPISPNVLIWAAPSLFFPLLMPFPYHLGALALLFGVGIAVFSPKRSFTGRIASGVFLFGLILLCQSAVIPLLIRILSRVHEVGILNRVSFPIATFLGAKASLVDGLITFPFYEGSMAFPGTLEKSGLFFLALTVAGGMVTLLFSGATLKQWLIFIVSVLVYWMARYVVMIFVFAQVKQAVIFYKPISVILSYLPLGAVLGCLLPVTPNPGPLINRMATLEFSRNSVKSFLFLTLGVVAIMGLFGFHDPGKMKQGRILIDEKHSDWEWSMRKFDTTWFGSQSTYNYYSMAAYLKSFYHVDHLTKGDLTPEILNRCDILILKTPTRAFSDGEIEAISNFVEKGGGLFLVGDHTNVFGTSFYLNPVAKRFGLFFNYDSTYDLDSGKLTVYEKPRIFPHPVVKDLPYFLFATSCTIRAPFGAEDVMTGYGIRMRLLSYSGRAFFEDKPLQDYEFGLFLQASAVKKGKGRVVAFSDSTCFSNFYMFIPGKPELVQGIMSWLNRENRFGAAPYLFILLTIGFFISGYRYSGKSRERTLILGGLSLLPGVALGILLFSGLTNITFAPKTPHTPFKKVFFEREYSDFSLPLRQLVDKDPKNYHTFFVWTQRVDLVPQLKEKLTDCLEEKDGFLIILNPAKPFSGQTLKKLVSFVEKGGRLLILDGPQNKTRVIDPLLAEFGMEMNRIASPKSDLVDREGNPMGETLKSSAVTGGLPFLRTKDNQAIFSIKRIGKGKIGVMADSLMFSNPVMGGTQITPSPLQLEIYQKAFYLLTVMEKP